MVAVIGTIRLLYVASPGNKDLLVPMPAMVTWLVLPSKCTLNVRILNLPVAMSGCLAGPRIPYYEASEETSAFHPLLVGKQPWAYYIRRIA